MRKVESERILHAKPEQAIQAFLDPQLLSDWWAVDRTLIEAREGGLYLLGWEVTEKGFGYVSTGIIEHITPARLSISQMAYLNPAYPILGPMRLKVEASTDKSGCRLRVMQDGYQTGSAWNWYYHAVKEAWPTALANLARCLEKIET